MTLPEAIAAVRDQERSCQPLAAGQPHSVAPEMFDGISLTAQ